MAFIHYLELLFHYRRLALHITLAVAGTAALFSLFMLISSPVYTATASVTILPTQAELSFSRRFLERGGSNTTDLMMQTHIEYLLSRPVAQLTLEKLKAVSGPPEEPSLVAQVAGAVINGLRVVYHIINNGSHVPPSPEDEEIQKIQDSVSVRVVEGSYILQIAASASSGQAAALIANTLADAYVQRASQMTDSTGDALVTYLKQEIAKRHTQLDPQGAAELRNRLIDVELSRAASIGQVRVISPAIAPLYPTFPKLVPTTLAGGVAGGLTAVLIIILLDIFTNRLRTSADLAQVVDRQSLGRVPEALSAIAASGTHQAVVPLRSGSSFAANAGPRLGLLGGARHNWVHVVGVGGPKAAREGGLALAAVHAYSGIPAEVDFGKEGRFRISRQGEVLHFEPAKGDKPFSGVVVTTAGSLNVDTGHLLTRQRGDGDAAPGEGAAIPAVESLRSPLIVFAIAAGQVSADMLAMMTTERDFGTRPFFLLVS